MDDIDPAFKILAALVAVYLILGILYERYIHPTTILSTRPPTGRWRARDPDAVRTAS